MEIDGKLWYTLKNYSSGNASGAICRANLDGTGQEVIKSFSSSEKPFRNLVKVGSRIYGLAASTPSVLGQSPGFIFSINANVGTLDYRKELDIPGQGRAEGSPAGSNADSNELTMGLGVANGYLYTIVRAGLGETGTEFPQNNALIYNTATRTMVSYEYVGGGGNIFNENSIYLQFTPDPLTFNNKAYIVDNEPTNSENIHLYPKITTNGTGTSTDYGNYTDIGLNNTTLGNVLGNLVVAQNHIYFSSKNADEQNHAATKILRLDSELQNPTVTEIAEIPYLIPTGNEPVFHNVMGFAAEGGSYTPEVSSFNDITVDQGQQNIVLDAQTYSDGAITYSIVGNPTGVSLSGNTLTIGSNATGVITVRASVAPSSDLVFKATTKDMRVTVRANQTITFGAISDKPVGLGSFTLNATASSGLQVMYSSTNESVATVTGSTVTLVAPGTTNIIARQAGNGSYVQAPDVQQQLRVLAKVDQTITFGSLPTKTFNDANFNLTATASSGLTVAFRSLDPSVATVSENGNTVTIVGVGTARIEASQPGDANYNAATTVEQTLTVNKANQIITFGSLAAKTYGDSNFNVTATSSSGLAITSYTSLNPSVATVSGNTVTIVAGGTATIRVSQAGNANYNAAPTVEQTLTVNKRSVTVTPTSGLTKTLGDADPTTFTYTLTTGSLVGDDSFSGSLSRQTGEKPGNYAITLGTLTLPNNGYTISVSNVNFSITASNAIVWDDEVGNGLWNSLANWSGDSAPTSSTDIVIPETTSGGKLVGTVRIRSTAPVHGRKLFVGPNTNLIVESLTNSALILSDKSIIQGTLQLAGSAATNSGLNPSRSSVLISSVAGSGSVKYIFNTGTVHSGTIRWHIFTPPVAGLRISDFVNDPLNANLPKDSGSGDAQRYALGKFDGSRPAGSQWTYYTVGELKAGGSKETDTFNVGESYAIAFGPTTTVTFKGSLSVETIDKTVTSNVWNAVGNPYTAYIPLTTAEGDNNNFIRDNMANLHGTQSAIYVWNSENNRYDPIALGGTPTAIPPGQGFLVRAASSANTVRFDRSRRSTKPSTGNSAYTRTQNTTPSIELRARLNGMTIHTDIRYFDHASLGLDQGYDAADFAPNSFDLYTKLLDGYQDENFIIQALPKKDFENMVIPIGLIADSGSQITFSADVLNLPAGIEAYLEDRALGTFTNLSKQNASYMVTLNTKVNGHGRFYLRTMSSSLSNGDNPELLGVKVYTTDANTLMIQGIDSEEARMEMYSVIGTQVLGTKFRGTGVNQIKLPNLASGIYIVRLATEKGTIQKKIVLE